MIRQSGQGERKSDQDRTWQESTVATLRTLGTIAAAPIIGIAYALGQLTAVAVFSASRLVDSTTRTTEEGNQIPIWVPRLKELSTNISCTLASMCGL